MERPSTARAASKKQAVAIVNPVNTDLRRLRKAIAFAEEQDDWRPCLWFETTIDDPGQRVARAALAHDPSVVIVAGGDGTIRAVAEEVHSSEIPLALVPTGTGNLLARNLGLMSGLEGAVHTALRGSTRAIDVGFVELDRGEGDRTTRAFLVMTGIGLDASMATDTNSRLKKWVGWLAYTDPISRSVLRNEQFSMSYRVDGRHERSVRAHTVIVGNCGTLTAGILLLPDAKVDDGLLDVVLLRPKGLWQWLRIGSRITAGGIFNRTTRGRAIARAAPRLQSLEYAQAQQLAATFDSPQTIQLDGDSFGPVTAVRISLRRHALRICIPE